MDTGLKTLQNYTKQLTTTTTSTTRTTTTITKNNE